MDFGHPLGSEQAGMRPAVVVASELHCRFPIDMTIVVPTTARDHGLPHHVPITSRESGLNRPSWARTENITAISTRRMPSGQSIGELAPTETNDVNRWIHRMIAH
ncbi:type II toxin-antitoxin system PemK/MazF family toxin [Protofrankia symbiont of Coriaria ruscifolia]|uniref:type II toxin-antitoxin system PemK/MazF family toxin n=1 Tax=Protofrankia symbiont of Coriaria ruscifolia TaxID=1306542 RepID=UPI001F5F29D7|nr:type II toxin-antitoxin system PemK/MazF family toxin [Protofrankia symbiont of Coriaria ruscifolia]